MNRSESLASLLVASQRDGMHGNDKSKILHAMTKVGKHKPNYKSESDYFFRHLAFTLDECWYWRGALDTGGYGVSCRGKIDKAHRFAWRLFRGDMGTLNVLHTCDVRSCVNPEHLYLGTQLENMRDCARRGRHVTVPKIGEENPQAKLSQKEVVEMRSLRAQGVFYKDIAKAFGVSTMTAHRAITRKSWGHV